LIYPTEDDIELEDSYENPFIATLNDIGGKKRSQQQKLSPENT
jgi:hypothetical protein